MMFTVLARYPMSAFPGADDVLTRAVGRRKTDTGTDFETRDLFWDYQSKRGAADCARRLRRTRLPGLRVEILFVSDEQEVDPC